MGSTVQQKKLCGNRPANQAVRLSMKTRFSPLAVAGVAALSLAIGIPVGLQLSADDEPKTVTAAPQGPAATGATPEATSCSPPSASAQRSRSTRMGGGTIARLR